MFRLLTLFLVLATPAHAFDGEREGLVVGGGLGGAMSVVSQDFRGATLDDFTRFGPAFDLRAGWGVSEAIQVFASLRGSWIRYDTQNKDASDVLHGTLGLGMVQHLREGRSDWYSTGQLGFAFFDLIEEGGDVLRGFGFSAGMGREWRPHFGTEFLIGWESTKVDTAIGEFGNSVLTFRLQVVGVLY